MELSHDFTVPMPLPEAAAWFSDPANVASCFPGMTISGVEGAEFTGSLRVAFGSLAVTYVGNGSYQERGPEQFVVHATGTARGIGSASINQTAVLTADGPDATAVRLSTDLEINGRPSQFGYAGITDVSVKLLDQFQANLTRALAPPEPEPEAEEVKVPNAAQEAIDTGAALAHMYRKQLYVGLLGAFLLGVVVARRLFRHH